MPRFWLSIAVALFAGPALFAAEVEVRAKPSATPASSRPTGSASPAASQPAGSPPGTSPSAALPQYRPAVLTVGPNSVVNRIDTAGLIKDGQKDGSLYFRCSVSKTGEITNTWTYKQTPDSERLERELIRCLDEAVFIPAVYDHETVETFFFGAVIFKVVDGKPRLRIFANQETEELKKESDFIGPQPFVGRGSNFEGLHYPSDAVTSELTGLVEMEMKVDANGKLQELKVVSEYPPLVGFRRAAAEDLRVATFIPAFRDGKPVACTVTLPIYYEP
jgi:hypothetical protein